MLKNRKKFGRKLMAKIPSTRYQGSKQKIVDWIWEEVKELQFKTFLDAFGGTGVVGYYAKTQGKSVTYNDILKANYFIGKSLIENNSKKLSKDDVEYILKKHDGIDYNDFIERTFEDIYFTKEENQWLDMVIVNISSIKDEYKKAIAFNALFQSCIIKRPYNLFHRKNLYVRFANVERSFGNKKTWDTPFPEHFKNFVEEINSLVFDNHKKNISKNEDVFELPIGYDLVYIDTPYFSSHSNIGLDYRDFYHFIEGIVNYEKWKEMIDTKSKHKRLMKKPCVWTDKKKIVDAFDELFKKFKDSILVVSYRSGGIPNEEKMIELMKKYKKNVVIKERRYKYALSHNGTKELLFIGTD